MISTLKLNMKPINIVIYIPTQVSPATGQIADQGGPLDTAEPIVLVSPPATALCCLSLIVYVVSQLSFGVLSRPVPALLPLGWLLVVVTVLALCRLRQEPPGTAGVLVNQDTCDATPSDRNATTDILPSVLAVNDSDVSVAVDNSTDLAGGDDVISSLGLAMDANLGEPVDDSEFPPIHLAPASSFWNDCDDVFDGSTSVARVLEKTECPHSSRNGFSPSTRLETSSASARRTSLASDESFSKRDARDNSSNYPPFPSDSTDPTESEDVMDTTMVITPLDDDADATMDVDTDDLPEKMLAIKVAIASAIEDVVGSLSVPDAVPEIVPLVTAAAAVPELIAGAFIEETSLSPAVCAASDPALMEDHPNAPGAAHLHPSLRLVVEALQRYQADDAKRFPDGVVRPAPPLEKDALATSVHATKDQPPPCRSSTAPLPAPSSSIKVALTGRSCSWEVPRPPVLVTEDGTQPPDAQGPAPATEEKIFRGRVRNRAGRKVQAQRRAKAAAAARLAAAATKATATETATETA